MKNKGFTIVETLVAITILVTVITGVMSAVQTGISSYILTRNQIIAFNLAQEGVEQIRSIRDNNGLQGANWLSGIASVPGDPCYFGKACRVSPAETSSAIECGAPGSCQNIRLQAANGFYGYNAGWALTPFRREITITQVNSHEVAIRVSVTWSKGLITRNFVVQENIFAWQ